LAISLEIAKIDVNLTHHKNRHNGVWVTIFDHMFKTDVNLTHHVYQF